MTAHGPEETSELAKSLFVEQRAQGDVDVEALIREHPELEQDLRRLEAGYRQAESVLGRVMVEPGKEGGSSGDGRRRLAERLAELDAPRTSESYRERRQIARGGMSRVFEVWDQRLRRRVAMKVLPVREPGVPGSQAGRRRLTRFLEEAQVTGQLGHPSILSVHELGLDAEGCPFFTMPLVEGKTFGEVVKLVHAGREGWTMARALAVLVRVCEAVAFAHSKGVVHRDLKPANILVGPFGETYVVDWGLAKVVGDEGPQVTAELHDDEREARREVTSLRDRADDSDSSLFTLDGDVVGTPCYMAPEQAEGRLAEIDARTDVYSTGAVLYQLLTGRRPYDGPSETTSASRVLSLVKKGPPESIHQSRPTAPTELVAICEKAMARAPQERYGDLLSMARDIEAFLDGRVVAAHATGAWVGLKKWVARNRPLAAALVGLVLAVFGGLGAVFVVQAQKQDVLAGANAELRKAAYYDAITIANHEIATGRSIDIKRLLNEIPVEERGFEWRILDGLSDMSEGRLLFEADMETRGTGVWRMGSPRRVVVGTNTGLKVCSEAGEVLLSFEESLRGPRWLAFGPEGTRFLAHYGDHNVYLHDVQTGESSEFSLPDAHVAKFLLPGEERVVLSHQGGLRALDLATGEIEDVLELRNDPGNVSARISPTGTCFAWVQGDQVRVFDLPEVRERFVIEVPQLTPPGSVAFSDDGLRILVRSRKSAAFGVFETSSGELLSLLGDERDELQPGGWAGKPADISSDGSWVATGRISMVEIWDVESGEKLRQLHGHEERVKNLVIASDDTLFSGTGLNARRWDLTEAEVPRILRLHSEAIYDHAFSPDGTRIATVGNDGALVVWDRQTRERVFRVAAHRIRSRNVGFTPDGQTICTSGRDGYLRFWNAADGRALSEHRLGHEGVCDLLSASSGDGLQVVATFDKWADGALTGIRDKQIQFKVRTGVFPTSLAVAPSGKRFAVGATDGTVEIRDCSSGEELVRFRAHTNRVVCAYSHAGDRIATASYDGLVRLWTPDGALERELGGHAGRVNGVAFTGDGGRVLSCGNDGTLRVWNPEDGRNVLTLTDPISLLNQVVVGPEGDVIAVATNEGKLLLWPVPLLEARSNG